MSVLLNCGNEVVELSEEIKDKVELQIWCKLHSIMSSHACHRFKEYIQANDMLTDML